MAENSKPDDATTDQAISTLIRSMISALIARSREEDYGKTPLEKLEYTLTDRTKSESLLKGINSFTEFLAARAAERQAKALETIAAQGATHRIVSEANQTAQAIIDAREPKREHLALTYSLPPEMLTHLWAMRGIVMDAAVKSLSRPDRFDPYGKVYTDDMAYTLRLSTDEFLARLPRKNDGSLDVELLDAFDIRYYGGSTNQPDEWMYGG